MKVLRTALAAAASLCSFSAFANTCVPLQAGAVDQTVYIEFIDNTTGLPNSGRAFGDSGIDIEYVRSGAAATDITEVTQTAAGAHSDGGFVSVGHGRYRLDLPDAAVAAGVPQVVVQGIITGYTMLPCSVALSPPANVVQVGNQTASASGAVTFPGTIASTTNITAATGVTVSTNSDKTGYALTQTFPTNFSAMDINATGGVGLDWANVQAPTTTLSLSGTSTKALEPATAGRTLVVDAAGLADANTVKVGPTGAGTTQTARDIGGAVPAAAAGASGGLPINGTNAGNRTFSGTTTYTGHVSYSDGIGIPAPSTTNRAGFSSAGNGTGPGFLGTGGATAPGFFGVGGSTSGLGWASSFTAPSGSFTESGMVRSGTLTGTHSTTTADLGTNAPTRDISCMTIYFPDHDLPKVITSYATGTGIATFATTTETFANGDDWFLYGTPCGVGGFPSVTDIWSNATRTLTAGTNIVLAKGTGVTGFNDLSTSDVQSSVWGAAVASYVAAGTTGLRLSRLPDAAAGGLNGLPIVNASNQVAGVSGNVLGSVASVTGNVSGSVGSVAGNVAGNVTGSVGSLGTTAQTNVQTATTAALNALQVGGEPLTELVCRMAAALAGASTADPSANGGNGNQVFSNAGNTAVRFTMNFGTDAGDRTISVGTACGN